MEVGDPGFLLTEAERERGRRPCSTALCCCPAGKSDFRCYEAGGGLGSRARSGCVINFWESHLPSLL